MIITKSGIIRSRKWTKERTKPKIKKTVKNTMSQSRFTLKFLKSHTRPILLKRIPQKKKINCVISAHRSARYLEAGASITTHATLDLMISPLLLTSFKNMFGRYVSLKLSVSESKSAERSPFRKKKVQALYQFVGQLIYVM